MIALVISLLAIVLSVHAVIFGAAADWHRKQGALWTPNPYDEYARPPDAVEPWYVRYATWLDGRLP